VKKKFSQKIVPYIFISPFMALTSIFIFYSVAHGIWISFHEWSVITSPRWIGFKNYARTMNDPLFWTSVKNTAVYTAGTVFIGIFCSLILAIIMNKKFKLRGLFRSFYFFPVVVSMTAVALTWQYMFDPHNGIINYLLTEVGLQPLNWLGDKRLAMITIIFVSIWKGMGWNMLIFLGGLQAIPTIFYEAAEVDGANRWHCFINITLPLIKPIFLFVLITSIISAFKVFDIVYVMTEGGPMYATTTIVQYVYRAAFQFFEMGYASAVAYILFLIVLIITWIQLRYFKAI